MHLCHEPMSDTYVRYWTKILNAWSHPTFTTLRGDWYYCSHFTVDQVKNIHLRLYKCHFLHLTTIVFYLPMSRFLFLSVTHVLISLISSIQSWFGGRLNVVCECWYLEWCSELLTTAGRPSLSLVAMLTLVKQTRHDGKWTLLCQPLLSIFPVVVTGLRMSH